jgi:hypothetical protein
MIVALTRLFGWCRHREMYREHREVEGRIIACYVCDCGHVEPILKRTPDEHINVMQKSRPARPGRV